MNIIKENINPLIIKLGKGKEKKYFSEEPIIIGACPRSGTTILLSILGAHERIYAIPKQTYAFDKWMEETDPHSGKITYTPFRIDRLYRELLLRRIPWGAKRWLEKTPKHIRSFAKIIDYFDERVKLINVIRDGRDVVTSKHPKHNPGQYWVSVGRWVSDVSIGLSLAQHPCVLNVRYEDLITEFEKTMLKIYDFLGEQAGASLQSWKEKTNIKKSMHWDKPVQDLYSHALARWKKPQHQKRIAEFMENERAVALLKELGYL